MDVELIASTFKRIETELATLKAELFQLPVGNRVAQYIDAVLHYRPGLKVEFSIFFGGFKQWLPERERDDWPKARVIQELPQSLKIVNEGRSDQPKKMIDGLSFTAPPPSKPEPEPKAAYDRLPMGKVVRSMINEWDMKTCTKKYSWADIAAKLNEEGILDPDGDEWDGHTAASFYHS
jgi:hypothetical protein